MFGFLRRSLFTSSTVQRLKPQIVQSSVKRHISVSNITRFEPILMNISQIQKFEIVDKFQDKRNGPTNNNQSFIIPLGEEMSKSIDEIKADSVMRKRRKKMKKHKLRKRRREQRAMKKKLARG